METKHTPEVTAEEFVREKIRKKYNAINKITKALFMYDVNGEECLRWAKEFSDLKLSTHQQTIAELSNKLEVCFILEDELIKERDELKKQNAELVKRLKELSNCRVGTTSFHLARINAINLILQIESTK